MINQVALMTSEQVAEFLQVSPRTLANWRSKKQGPQGIRIGPSIIRYRVSDVNAFLKTWNPSMEIDNEQALVA